jgi:hypothetical protein
MTAKHLVSACLAVVLFAPSQAAGQEPATTPQTAARASVEKGARLFAQAEKKHDRALYEAAYLQFVQAYAVFPDDRVLWNLGMCEIRTERYIEGLAHLRTYDAHLHVSAQPTSPYSSMLAELLKVGNAATGHLAVDAPAGSVVIVDGKKIDHPAPLIEPIDVQPGDHAVTAQLGDKNAKLVITAPAGTTTGVHLVFAADPPSPLLVPVATAPTSSTPAPDMPSETPSSPSSSTRAVLTVSALGVGVVGLGLGIGFRLAAQSKSSDLAAFQVAQPGACANPTGLTCAQSNSLRDDVNRDSTISTVGYVVAGVGAVSAAAFWFLWPASSTRAAWVLPSIGAGSAELHVGGSF